MRSKMESNLNYWDEVIVINKFVSDVIQLYPMSQYWFNCECKLCDEDLILVNMLRYQIFQMN